MSWSQICSSMLAAPPRRHKFSRERTTLPLPRPVGLPSLLHPPVTPPRPVHDAVGCAASAGMDRRPHLFKLPFDSISSYCIEDKRSGKSFPGER